MKNALITGIMRQYAIYPAQTLLQDGVSIRAHAAAEWHFVRLVHSHERYGTTLIDIDSHGQGEH